MKFLMAMFSLSLISLGLGPNSRADWLYFARGGQAELPASIRGLSVEVTTSGETMSFPLSSFRAIVAGGRIDDDWQERQRVAAMKGSAEAWFEAAWWALEQGLTPEAIVTLRTAAKSPQSFSHAPLGRATQMIDALEAPVIDADLKPVQSQLEGTGWTELRGRHVILIHQASATYGAERLEVLDRVVETFYLSLAAQGIELPVSRHRLISVWFARQIDYQKLLRRIEATPFVETQGYYHPNFGVVFAFDTRSTDDQVRARERLADRRKNHDLSSERLADLDRQSLLLDLRWRSVDLGIAAHETVHQLVAASGLAPRFDAWPNWLHEGFSSQFEVVRGGRWAGFGRTNDFRLPDWRSIVPAPRLPPLLSDEGLTYGYRRSRYAESWALVHFLRKTRPAEFTLFLDRLRTPRTSLQEDATRVAFTAAFGEDLESIQSDWRKFMQQQVTPLEEHSRTIKLGNSF